MRVNEARDLPGRCSRFQVSGLIDQMNGILQYILKDDIQEEWIGGERFRSFDFILQLNSPGFGNEFDHFKTIEN